jgi:hypothetical protein
MVDAHFAVLLLVLAELNWILFRVLIGPSTRYYGFFAYSSDF